MDNYLRRLAEKGSLASGYNTEAVALGLEDRKRQNAMNAYLGKFKEREMDDLERLARDLHKWPENALAAVELLKGTGFYLRDGFVLNPVRELSVTKYEWQAKRDELSGQPKEWINDWARWRAQDKDGKWFEFNKKPLCQAVVNKWTNDSVDDVSKVSEGEVLSDWRETLEKRVMEDKEEWMVDVECDQLFKPEWVDGLPPVGVKCEWTISEGSEYWQECEIKGYYKEQMWMDDGTLEGEDLTCHISYLKFRPIKSNKEKAIEEMIDIINDNLTAGGIAVALYSEGYRKTEA